MNCNCRNIWRTMYSVHVYSIASVQWPTFLLPASWCWPGWRDLDDSDILAACPASSQPLCGKIWRIWPLTAPPSLPILSIAIILERDLYAVAQEIYFLGFTRNILSVRRLDEAICARSDTMAINTVGVQSSYVLHLNSELIESENTEHYCSQACWRPLERLHQFGV